MKPQCELIANNMSWVAANLSRWLWIDANNVSRKTG